MTDFVFHDPTGRRAKQANLGVGLLVALAALIVAGFFATLAFAPRLPSLTLSDPRALQALHDNNAHRLQATGQLAADSQPRQAGERRADPPAGGRLLCHLGRELPRLPAPSRQSARCGLAAVGAARRLRRPGGGHLRSLRRSDDRLGQVAAVDPAHGPQRPQRHQRRAAGQRRAAQPRGAGRPGRRTSSPWPSSAATPAMSSTWRTCRRRPWRAYPACWPRRARRSSRIGREVWVSTPFGDNDWNLQEIPVGHRHLVLMAYDQHWGGGDPGPAAGQDWFETTLANDMGVLDRSRTIVALGSYGYDWTAADAKGPAKAAAVTFYDATQEAHDADADVSLDDDALNPHLRLSSTTTGASTPCGSSTPPPSSTRSRSPTLYRPQGYALWRMGGEDPVGLAVCSSRPTARPSRSASKRSRPASAWTSTAPAKSCTSVARPRGGKPHHRGRSGHRPDLRREPTRSCRPPT